VPKFSTAWEGSVVYDLDLPCLNLSRRDTEVYSIIAGLSKVLREEYRFKLS